MKEKLTQSEIDLMPVIRDKWIDKFNSCDRIDKEKTKDFINFVYDLAKLPKPKHIIYVSSPYGCQLAYQLLKQMNCDSVSESVRDSVWASVWASVSDSVRDSVWGSVWGSVRDSVRGSVRDSVRGSVRDSVSNFVRDSVRDSVWESVRASVSDSVRDSVRDSVSNFVSESVRASVWESVRASVSDSVWASVRDSVWASVRDSVRGSVRDSVSNSVSDYQYILARGIDDYPWLAFYNYFQEIGILDQIIFDQYKNLVFDSNMYDALVYNDCAIICEMPEYISRDLNNKLHSLEKSAIKWADGFEIFAINGVKFEKILWEKIVKKTITPKEIFEIENAEQKSIALRIYGYEEMLKDIQHKIIDTANLVDDKGRLLEYQVIEVDLKDDIDAIARFVKVQCWTTSHSTLLRVDPRVNQTKNCIGAIAWTAGMTEQEYILEHQT